MAEKNISPRQRMIGMMYLVLTAMLALNVQREVLDAFVVLNEGNEISKDATESRASSMYADFKFAHNLDPQKVDSYWNKAQSIKKESDDIVCWIDSLKSELVSITEGIDLAVADTISLSSVKSMDRYDDATRIMIGHKEDGSSGKAHALKLKLEGFERSVQNHFDELPGASPQTMFDFSDHVKEDGVMNWEMHTFFESPLAAVMAILTKLQNDTRNLEFSAGSSLLAMVDGEDIPIDTVLAKAIPRSDYVILGQEYVSDIALMAYSTTSAPEVILGDFDEATGTFSGPTTPLDVIDGVGQYSIKPTSEGVHSYAGAVKVFDKQGNAQLFPFKSEFLVAKPTATVSATKMNVMYIGPKNPLSISVPGIPDDKVKVRISGGNRVERTGKGQYEASLKTSTPREIDVIVSAELESGMKEMGRMKFRVKSLPEPSITFRGEKHQVSASAFELARSSIKPQYADDFLFQMPLTLVSYKVVIKKKDGNVFDRIGSNPRLEKDPKVGPFVSAAKIGEDMWIEDVKVRDVTGKVWHCNPIRIEVSR